MEKLARFSIPEVQTRVSASTRQDPAIGQIGDCADCACVTDEDLFYGRHLRHRRRRFAVYHDARIHLGSESKLLGLWLLTTEDLSNSGTFRQHQAHDGQQQRDRTSLLLPARRLPVRFFAGGDTGIVRKLRLGHKLGLAVCHDVSDLLRRLIAFLPIFRLQFCNNSAQPIGRLGNRFLQGTGCVLDHPLLRLRKTPRGYTEVK